MIAIPIQVNGQEYDVWIVLNDESIDRIKQYDPAEYVLDKATDYRGLKLRGMVITYGNEADINQVWTLAKAGKMPDALRHLSRGSKFKPKSGDSDKPYESQLQSLNRPGPAEGN